MKKLLFVVLLAALLLSACGSPSAPTTAPADKPADTGSTGSASQPTAAPSGGDAAAPVEIKVWGHQAPAFNSAIQKMIDQYMKDNPNITVKYETFPWDVFIQTIQTSLPAGNTADVILIPGGYTCRYALGGQLLEVPADILSMDKAKAEYYDAPLGGQTCDGKLYGFPAEYNLEYGGAYINPDLFDQGHVVYPPAWKTWDDLMADAKILTVRGDDGVMSVAGLHYTNSDQLFTYFLAGILEQGKQYFAEDGKHFVFNSPEAVATIQKLMDMAQIDQVADPVIFNADSEWVGESFAQNHAAIAVLGSWYAGEAKSSYPDLKFDYVTLPPFMGSEYKFASVGGWGYVVGKATKTQPKPGNWLLTLASSQKMPWRSTPNLPRSPR